MVLSACVRTMAALNLSYWLERLVLLFLAEEAPKRSEVPLASHRQSLGASRPSLFLRSPSPLVQFSSCSAPVSEFHSGNPKG